MSHAPSCHASPIIRSATHLLAWLVLPACNQPTEHVPLPHSVDLHGDCWEDTDCREHLHCVNGSCEALTPADGATAPPHRDEVSEASPRNECGGRSILDHPPGTPCAPGCELGVPIWQCGEGNEHVFCGFAPEDAHLNRCGGTACLLGSGGSRRGNDVAVAAPGDPCGECGRYVCDGLDALRCAPGNTNACGGCEPLALPRGISAPLIAPGEPCGHHPLAHCGWLECDGVVLRCADDAGVNACGRCREEPDEQLDLIGGRPLGEQFTIGDSCRTDDGRSGTWRCLPDGRAAECIADGYWDNGCDGTSPLDGYPGQPCGPCGKIWDCDGTERVECVQPPVPPPTCTCEEESAGLPCPPQQDRCCRRGERWLPGCSPEVHVQECTDGGTAICATMPGGSNYESLDFSLSDRCGPDCVDCTAVFGDRLHARAVCRQGRCGLECEPGACLVVDDAGERCEPRVELCGDRADNDCDGEADEEPQPSPCLPCDGVESFAPLCDQETGEWHCPRCPPPEEPGEDAGASHLPEEVPEDAGASPLPEDVPEDAGASPLPEGPAHPAHP